VGKSNRYAGILDNQLYRRIVRQARRRGFRGQDLDDAVHTVVLYLTGLKTPAPARNLTTEASCLATIIDRQLVMLHRGRSRRQQHFDEMTRRGVGVWTETTADQSWQVREDVRKAIAALPSLSQQVCNGLSEGLSLHAIARRLGVDWHTVDQQRLQIRWHFEALGLGPSAC
jgi:DNA-directed RNA polymerase specialized sigma24 family protein